MIAGLKKRRDDLNQGIIEDKELGDLERYKLLLEMEQQ